MVRKIFVRYRLASSNGKERFSIAVDFSQRKNVKKTYAIGWCLTGRNGTIS